MSNELAIMPENNSIQELQSRLAIVDEMIKSALKKGIDYGTVPRVPKPFLWKSGAEKLCFRFGLKAKFSFKTINYDKLHREIQCKCVLYRGEYTPKSILGEGYGTATTFENKWKRDNPADMWDTIKKMAEKRAYTDAVIRVLGISGLFSQDDDVLNTVYTEYTVSEVSPDPIQEAKKKINNLFKQYCKSHDKIDPKIISDIANKKYNNDWVLFSNSINNQIDFDNLITNEPQTSNQAYEQLKQRMLSEYSIQETEVDEILENLLSEISFASGLANTSQLFENHNFDWIMEEIKGLYKE